MRVLGGGAFSWGGGGMIFMISCVLLGSVEEPVTKWKETSKPHIKTQKAIKQPVNENHPDVLALVAAGYTVEASIQAISKNKSVGAALEFLGESSGSDADGEMDVIPVSKEHKLSHGDFHQEIFGINW